MKREAEEEEGGGRKKLGRLLTEALVEAVEAKEEEVEEGCAYVSQERTPWPTAPFHSLPHGGQQILRQLGAQLRRRRPSRGACDDTEW